MANTDQASTQQEAANGDTNCLVCGSEHVFRWTDTHGIAVCSNCGAPHTVLHYDGDVRVERPPKICLKDEGITLARRYWSEKQRMVFPGVFDMGILGGRGRSYSGASPDDVNAFQDWYDAQPEVIAERAAGGPEAA